MRKFLLFATLAALFAHFGCSEADRNRPTAREQGERSVYARRPAGGTSDSSAALSGNGSAATASSSAPSPPVAAAVVPSVATHGTLEVELIATAGFPSVNESSGPWLYIDGRLARDYSPQSLETIIIDTLTVGPGSFLIEAVAAGRPRGGVDMPLTILRRRVRVECGQTIVFSQTFPMLEATGLPRQGPWATPPDDPRRWARDWQARADQQMNLYEFDSLAAAIVRLEKQSPVAAKSGLAWLDIPESLGGRREVNAAQVRLFVDWLESHYWGDWPTQFTDRIRSPGESTPPDVEAQLRELETVTAGVERHRLEIRQLRAVGDKLDAAQANGQPSSK